MEDMEDQPVRVHWMCDKMFDRSFQSCSEKSLLFTRCEMFNWPILSSTTFLGKTELNVMCLEKSLRGVKSIQYDQLLYIFTA